MKKLLTNVAFVGLGLALVLALPNQTEAKGPKGPGRGHATSRNHHNSHRSHYDRNHYRNLHHNWSSWYWNGRFRCYCYRDRYDSCYYYWYAPGSCYYPISYIDECPPTEVPYRAAGPGAAPLPVTVQVTNINQNGVPGLPGLAIPRP